VLLTNKSYAFKPITQCFQRSLYILNKGGGDGDLWRLETVSARANAAYASIGKMRSMSRFSPVRAGIMNRIFARAAALAGINQAVECEP
jgi:hypothetical protein